MKRYISAIAAGALMLSAGMATAQDKSMFTVRELPQGTDAAVTAIRDYAEGHEDWLYMAEFGLAGGKVTAVKICYAPLGPDLVAAGLHVMAMMPCGHLAFYEEDGKAKMSMLNLDFLTTLESDPNLQSAVEKGEPAFTELFAETLD